MKKSFAIVRAMALEAVSMATCFIMFLNCTFAWYTDGVTSGVNRIEAGRLQVNAYHQTWVGGKPDTAVTDEDRIEGKSNLFRSARNGDNGSNGTNYRLWEPGAMAVETFTIQNEGNLALKYRFNLVVAAFNRVTWSAGTDSYDLRDVVRVAIISGDDMANYSTREHFEALPESSWLSWDEYVSGAVKTGSLDPAGSASGGDSESFIVAMHWPSTENDNHYNLQLRDYGEKTVVNCPSQYSGATDSRLYIDVKTVVGATQNAAEADSFGSDYDTLAELETPIP